MLDEFSGFLATLWVRNGYEAGYETYSEVKQEIARVYASQSGFASLVSKGEPGFFSVENHQGRLLW